MAIDKILKSFAPSKKNKEVKYLSKDFSQYRDRLIEFSKTYFPNTYRDFTDASTGMMFIEMASYVGDVLSYYIDYQFKESLIVYAEERKNLMSLARYLGYKVKPATAATTVLDVFQLIPATDTGEPNYKYALNISEGMQVSATNGAAFRTLNPVNFAYNTQDNPTEITVYSRDSYGNPLFFLLKKQVTASSGKLVTKQIQVKDAIPFYRTNLGPNVLDIIDVRDSDNNRWYETDYLAQDLVFIDVENIPKNDQVFSQYNDTVPYIMKTLRTSRKFITIVDPNNDTFLEFGGGTEASSDELIVPNLNNVSRNGQFRIGEPLDPSNFLKTKMYGQAPENTTLTITYIMGGGIVSNVNSRELNSITTIDISNDVDLLSPEEQALLNTVKRSIQVVNTVAATGGSDAESEESIRQNAMASFMAQNRAVTRDDYIVRVLSMPSKYGAIAKVYVAQDSNLDVLNSMNSNSQDYVVNPTTMNVIQPESNNPFAINMYLLGYDKNKKFTTLNEVVLHNLRQYLNRYRMLTDGINLINGFVINIGVDFDIIVYKNYSKKEVLSNCIIAVSNFFDSELMGFCQPINVSNLELEIAKVEGVQSIQSVSIHNLTIRDGDYSEYEYDIEAATRNKIIYPSVDPTVFEIKFPSRDIRGKCL